MRTQELATQEQLQDEAQVVLKIDQLIVEQNKSGSCIERLKGYIPPSDMVRLYDTTTLTANPRLPKVNEQVRDMQDGIRDAPGMFRYRNNGVLVAASEVETGLERSRVRLSFRPTGSMEHPRGILNGGHTTFAVIVGLIMQCAGAAEQKMPKIRNWEDLRIAWKDWRDIVVDYAAAMDAESKFHVPIEVLWPTPSTSAEEFDETIYEISEARNNNTQLTDETKSNFIGCYEELKLSLPDGVSERVEWKSNTPGTNIKARDLVALATIPLKVAAENVPERESLHDFPAALSPSSPFLGQGKCVSFFDRMYKAVSSADGARMVIRPEYRELMESAIGCTKEIVLAFDWLEVNFPTYYNAANGKFGKLEAVDRKEAKEDKNGEIQMLETKYCRSKVETKFSNTLIAPLVTSLSALLSFEDGRVQWKIDPVEFLQRYMSRIMPQYKGILVFHRYIARDMARNKETYPSVLSIFEMLMEFDDLSSSKK